MVLLVMILGFAVSVYALLMQVFGIESDDKATIISGILSMVGAMIGAIVAGGIAIYVSRTQLTKQAELDDTRERQLIAIKIKLEKYQEINENYYALGRSYSKWFSYMVYYLNREITLDELRIEDDKMQNLILNKRTILRSYSPFFSNITESIRTIDEFDENLGNLIYDYFTFPERKFDTNQLNESTKKLMEINKNLLVFISNQTEDLNHLIQNELEKINQV